MALDERLLKGSAYLAYSNLPSPGLTKLDREKLHAWAKELFKEVAAERKISLPPEETHDPLSPVGCPPWE